MAALVKSAIRTLDLLELMSTSKNGLLLSDMSKTLDIPISSMHGLISTLEYKDYLIRDQSSLRYHFGPRYIQLVTAGSTNVDLVALASAILDRVQNECGEAVTMSVLQWDKIVFISNRPSSSIVQVVNKVGTELPAHATGSGKIMLAHLPADDVDRIYSDPSLPPKTERTIQERKVLKHALNLAREQGFAYDEGESEEGVWAVASCVRDSVGRPRAAVSIVVPEVRLREKKIPRWTEIITDAAMEISGKIGFKPN